MECTRGDDQSGGHKHKSTAGSNNNNNDTNKKLKMGINPLEYANESLCPWPPRNYKCSFCKREFKSAHALSGHMNMHRRERAELRSFPPSPSRISYITNPAISPLSNPNPNPTVITLYNPENPNVLRLSSLSSPPGIYAHQYCPVSLSLSFHHASASNLKASLSVDDKKEEDGGVKLDLELRLIRDTKEEDQDLDLELRLGTPAKSS